jgi:bifunctional non-homologous end joining protein LigD
MRFRPMPLVRIPEAFNHPDWTFEVKHDGFRALAFVRGHLCVLQSRNGSTFTRWPMLCEEIAHAIRATDAVIDGEIVCMGPDGRSHFRKLLYRAEWPYLLAFDLLQLEGRDLRSLPLVERKRLLATIMPRVESHMQFVDAIDERGEDFLRVVCEHDLEGVVAKPKYGPYYADGLRTNWLKIKNSTYSQLAGREDLFEARGAVPTRRPRAPQLMLPVVIESPTKGR